MRAGSFTVRENAPPAASENWVAASGGPGLVTGRTTASRFTGPLAVPVKETEPVSQLSFQWAVSLAEASVTVGAVAGWAWAAAARSAKPRTAGATHNRERPC